MICTESRKRSTGKAPPAKRTKLTASAVKKAGNSRQDAPAKKVTGKRRKSLSLLLSMPLDILYEVRRICFFSNLRFHIWHLLLHTPDIWPYAPKRYHQSFEDLSDIPTDSSFAKCYYGLDSGQETAWSTGASELYVRTGLDCVTFWKTGVPGMFLCLPLVYSQNNNIHLVLLCEKYPQSWFPAAVEGMHQLQESQVRVLYFYPYVFARLRTYWRLVLLSNRGSPCRILIKIKLFSILFQLPMVRRTSLFLPSLHDWHVPIVGGWSHGYSSKSRFFWKDDIENMILKCAKFKKDIQLRRPNAKKIFDEFKEQRRQMVKAVWEVRI